MSTSNADEADRAQPEGRRNGTGHVSVASDAAAATTGGAAVKATQLADSGAPDETATSVAPSESPPPPVSTEDRPRPADPITPDTDQGAEPEGLGGPGAPPRAGTITGRDIVRLSLVALAIVICSGGIGLVSSLLLPEQYVGRVELLYPIAIEQPTGFLREDRNLTTQLLVLQSRSTLEEVAATRGISVEELDERLSAEVVDTSEIIRVDVRSPSREEGVALVSAIVESYLAVSTAERPDPVQVYVQGQLDQTRRELAANPEDQALIERENALAAQLDSLVTEDLSRPRPSVLVPAYSVPDPVSTGLGAATATGSLLGMLVAAPVVLLLARRRSGR